MTQETKIPKSVSRYFAALARKANASMRGTEMAKQRSAKAVAALKRKAAQRKKLNEHPPLG